MARSRARSIMRCIGAISFLSSIQGIGLLLRTAENRGQKGQTNCRGTSEVAEWLTRGLSRLGLTSGGKAT